MSAMAVVALNPTERETIRALCAREILEPRGGRGAEYHEMLNDIAEMMVGALPAGTVEALRDC